MLAPLLVGAVVIRLLKRQRMSRPRGRTPRSEPYPLRTLSAVLVTVLIADAAAWLGAIAAPMLVGVSNVGFLVAMVMFVVWFYRARVNAEGHGWPQRWSPGWAIAGWLVPVVNFWFPFQIMADICARWPARTGARKPGDTAGSLVGVLAGVLLPAVVRPAGDGASSVVPGHPN